MSFDLYEIFERSLADADRWAHAVLPFEVRCECGQVMTLNAPCSAECVLQAKRDLVRMAREDHGCDADPCPGCLAAIDQLAKTAGEILSTLLDDDLGGGR